MMTQSRSSREHGGAADSRNERARYCIRLVAASVVKVERLCGVRSLWIVLSGRGRRWDR